MKIKEICEKTGLTDRTVRYYIEENLISPFYTENYLGRKAFDFSEEDLERLKEIATLRAFGFSVEEIKDISVGKLESQQIIEQVKQRTEESFDESQRRLRVLSGIDLSDEVGISQLAQRLSNADLVVEDNKTNRGRRRFRDWFRFFATLFAVWLPPLTAAVVLTLRFASCEDPIVRPVFFALTLVCFLPSLLAILILNKLKGSLRILRYILMLVCVLCLPLSIFFALNSVTVCDHSYAPYRTSIEATCYSEGEAILQCQYCQKFKTQSLEKVEHSPETEPGVAATCGKDGLTDRIYCSICQETLSEQTVVPKTQLHQTVVVQGVAPTCTTAGVTDLVYCSVCDATLSDSVVVPALGHTYDKQTDVPATCTSEGYTLHECTCGDSYQTDVVHNTNLHDFAFINWDAGYKCRVCELEVCEYGLADWSTYEADLIYYYITGPTDTSGNVDRTLVVYGSGDMPDFSAENPPSWASSPYLHQVKTIVIESGISSLGAYAFSGIPDRPDISYDSVTCFIIRSLRFDVHLYSQAISGISCKIMYDY